MTLSLRDFAATPRQPAMRDAYAAYTRRFGKTKIRSPRKEALVVLGTGIGNVVEQTSLLRAVIEMYKAVDVFLPLSLPVAGEVLAGLPGLRKLFIYREGYEQLRYRKTSYDAAFFVYLVCDFIDRIPAKVCYVSDDFTVSPLSEREACFNAAVLAGYTGKIPDVWCAVAAETGHVIHTPAIGISNSSADGDVWALKRYPYYAQVVTQLLQALPQFRIVQLGGAHDPAIEHAAVTNLCGATTLSQSAAIVRRCSLVLANDTGMSHVAAAVGTPTVTIFGPTKISKNLPTQHAQAVYLSKLFCRPCQYSQYGIGRYSTNGASCQNECLVQLSPEIVADKCLQILQNIK